MGGLSSNQAQAHINIQWAEFEQAKLGLAQLKP